MFASLKFMKVLISLIAISALAACSAASVEQDIAPQTTLQQPEAATVGQDQTTQENALASQDTTTPAQAVTETQIQPDATTTTQEVASLTPASEPAIDNTRAISFLPFEGAPQTKTASLTRLINQSARSDGITVLPSTRASAPYLVKGYFSALNDGNGTMLVYVWDIVDSTGKRLHRINGQERTGTSKTDPWQAITDTEMQRVAEATTARLKTWIERR